jgi:hypothetical protein
MRSHEVPNQQSPSQITIVKAEELARLLTLPVTWVYEQTRSRSRDPIPHLKMGSYVRFEVGSAALNAWIDRHRKNGGVQ